MEKRFFVLMVVVLVVSFCQCSQVEVNTHPKAMVIYQGEVKIYTDWLSSGEYEVNFYVNYGHEGRKEWSGVVRIGNNDYPYGRCAMGSISIPVKGDLYYSGGYTVKDKKGNIVDSGYFSPFRIHR